MVPPKERQRERPDRRADKQHEERARPRLDTPRELGPRISFLPNVGEDRFGIFAEQFARFMGTAKFILYMTVFVFVWVVLNLVSFVQHWDPYPFILLNLFFSTQASYAAPLILLAQNRQELRDRVVAEQDRQADAAAHADMEFLAREVAALRMALGEVATRDYVRSELRALLNELDERATPPGDEAGDDEPAGEDEADHSGPTPPAPA
ncbi:MAG: DUF1003 domain-containing protein [Marmoricola sp.]